MADSIMLILFICFGLPCLIAIGLKGLSKKNER